MNREDDEPIHLFEDPQTGDKFLVYGTEKGLRLDIKYEGETLWMTQAQIGELFGRDVSSISRHITNIFEEGELPESTSLQKVQTTTGRPATLYNLDVVISVGYRVSSAQATLFRRWATGILVQFAKKGFVVDTARLKQPENSDRITELKEIIRDIRADEANVYAELRKICAMCQDYDNTTEAAREFYQHTQAKLIFAVVSQTPAEVVASRAKHDVENMGLQTWPNDNIRKTDATVSKNYLTETEIKELNRLTTILLDIFEDQVDIGRLVVMQEAERLLEQQLKGLGRRVLKDGGSVSAVKAKRHAEAQYDKFDQQRKAERQQLAKKTINELAKVAKDLPSGRKR